MAKVLLKINDSRKKEAKTQTLRFTQTFRKHFRAEADRSERNRQ
jgi:hypothetical protein